MRVAFVMIWLTIKHVGLWVLEVLSGWYYNAEKSLQKGEPAARTISEDICSHPEGIESYLPHIEFVNGCPVSLRV